MALEDIIIIIIIIIIAIIIVSVPQPGLGSLQAGCLIRLFAATLSLLCQVDASTPSVTHM